MAATHYLVTGAARGIGRGLVAALLARPNTVVVATVRDVAAENARSLASLPIHASSRLIILKHDASDPKVAVTDAAKLVTDLQAQGVDRLDVVIANAGISRNVGPAADVSIEGVQEHFNVNTLGPLILFQAVWPALLSKSTKPIFVGISTGLASIGNMFPMPFVAYGTSKAALNYIIKKISMENESLIAFPLSPGWVQTDMGNFGAKAVGMTEAPETLENSVSGILKTIDTATKESSGKFLSFDGTTFEW